MKLTKQDIDELAEGDKVLANILGNPKHNLHAVVTRIMLRLQQLESRLSSLKPDDADWWKRA